MLTQLYKYMSSLLFDIKNRFNITVVAMCARCERGKLQSIVRRSSWSAHVHFARDSDLLSGGALMNHKTPKKAITLKGRTEFKLSSKFHGRGR